MNEIYHYPFLCAGWFGLALTSFNLIPIGSLDGGQILRTAFPSASRSVEWIVVALLALFGLLGLFDEFGFGQTDLFSPAWLLWALILPIVFLRKSKATVEVGSLTETEDIGTPRKGLAILSVVLLMLTFAPSPVSFR